MLKHVLIVLLVLGFSAPAFSADPPAKPLPYPQAQLLKDATYYLDQIENLLLNIEDRTKNAKPGEVQSGKLQSWIEWKDKANQYMTNVNTRLKQLPADHPKVKEQADRAAKYTASLEEQGKKLDALKGNVDKVLQQGEGAGYKADFDRLKEINQMFANPRVIEERPQKAIEIIKQMEPAKAERQRIVEKYADLLKQDSSKDLRSVIAYFDELYPKFEQATKTYASNAPAAIDKDIADATAMAKDAVANKKHLFFGENGGVRQRLSWAQTRLDVLSAIAPDAPATKAEADKLAAARAEVAKMRESLNDAIIESNEPPAERYNGADKTQLIELVKAKWATSGVNAQVLKIGINSQDWTRDTQWVWQATGKYWYKIDASKIQGFVIVKLDDKLAAIHHVNLIKDHLKNDTIEAFFFDDPKAAPDVNSKLVAGKVK